MAATLYERDNCHGDLLLQQIIVSCLLQKLCTSLSVIKLAVLSSRLNVGPGLGCSKIIISADNCQAGDYLAAPSKFEKLKFNGPVNAWQVSLPPKNGVYQFKYTVLEKRGFICFNNIKTLKNEYRPQLKSRVNFFLRLSQNRMVRTIKTGLKLIKGKVKDLNQEYLQSTLALWTPL